MTGAATLAPTAVALHPTHPGAGRVVLAPVVDDRTGATVWLVSPDVDAAMYYQGCADQAGAVVGGIVRERGRWVVTAYADRAHLFDTAAGPAWFLPDTRSRAAAARSLLRWWWYVGRQAAAGVDVRYLSPYDLSPAERRSLLG
jgi:hypothetical protein